ncbi:MAG TPA: hypothetical protein VLA03_10075 [Draconibacterium sp.]|nr:hypothetical protein [Draconibacterium sp.]
MNFSKVLQIIILFFGLVACQTSDKLPKVKEVDLSQIDPANFSQEEWYIPYYLKHFAEVANSVVDSGENRGYFDLSVWRGSHNHNTYNARIMEGILSLVWFYTTDRPWNIYYGDKALKKRIEASLQFWCKIQNTDGRFSEYSVGQWSLAPTAFATKFVGRTLWLLGKQGPQIDKDIFEQARVSLRKAIYIGFTHEGLWEHGRNYTNQFANLWGGALAYLDVWPDEGIENLLKKRFYESMTEFQSPLGFFYEKGGPDWGYNLNTHHSDLHVAWEYADEELRELIIQKTKNWYEWFSYNAVKEPGEMYYFFNRAIETRQQKGFYNPVELEDPAYQRWIPQAEFIPLAHAFEMNKEEYESNTNKKYNEMLEKYPEVNSLEVGEFNAFTPYAFLHHNMKMWLPSKKQKEEAIENLPYLKDSSFVKLMQDERSKTSYAFIRTLKYYATFNSGKIITDQQRYGLGLIWTPQLGTIFQSQSKTNEASWGTLAKDSIQVYEANDLIPELQLQEIEAGAQFENSTVNYNLGETGKKIITFHENKIVVQVNHTGAFSEILPVLISENDLISINGGQIKIETRKGSLSIHTSEKDGIVLKDFETDLGNKECKIIEISAKNKLSYEFIFE